MKQIFFLQIRNSVINILKMSEMFLINRCHLNKLFLTNDVKCILILFEYL